MYNGARATRSNASCGVTSGPRTNRATIFARTPERLWDSPCWASSRALDVRDQHGVARTKNERYDCTCSTYVKWETLIVLLSIVRLPCVWININNTSLRNFTRKNGPILVLWGSMGVYGVLWGSMGFEVQFRVLRESGMSNEAECDLKKKKQQKMPFFSFEKKKLSIFIKL